LILLHVQKYCHYEGEAIAGKNKVQKYLSRKVLGFSEAAHDHIAVLAGVLAMLKVILAATYRCPHDDGLYFPPTRRQPLSARV
jgi:hypothetical protein